MLNKYLVMVCFCFGDFLNADVPHLEPTFKTYNNHLDTFNGYHYGQPTATQVPIPAATSPSSVSTVFLPEIIVNKASKGYSNSNIYLPPAIPSDDNSVAIPPLADDFDTNGYLPPPFQDILPLPSPTPPIQSSVYLPPTSQFPPNDYLPPAVPTTSTVDENSDGYHYMPPKTVSQLKTFKNLVFSQSHQQNHKTNALQLELNELRCFKGRGGYFRANIAVQSFITNVPVLESDTTDPHCQLRLIRTKFFLNILAGDFERCGVYSCSDKELCIKLRFPQILGMKSLGDALLTLQCKLQERIVTKVHALRFGVTNANQGRSAGTFAQGGNQQPFRTQLGLYRQSGGAFTKSVDTGSIVQLGEELMLRVQVKTGDGWNHSRVSDISLQRVTSTGEILNSAALVTSNGCINPAMRSITLQNPVFEPPLGYRFIFRAVMFQGMKSGDEMIMSVRIVGCVEHSDCSMEQQNCDGSTAFVQSNRVRRHTTSNYTRSGIELIEVSKISFRVEMPKSNINNNRLDGQTIYAFGEIALAATIAVICLLLLIGLTFVNRREIQSYFVRHNH